MLKMFDKGGWVFYLIAAVVILALLFPDQSTAALYYISNFLKGLVSVSKEDDDAKSEPDS